MYRKAAGIIVGNEVLSGKILDENTHFLSQFLFNRGVQLRRVEIITDEIEDIAETVRKLSSAVGEDGFVFTSGGIGPTHDDVTYEGIARAFNRPLQLHQPTYDAMMAYFESKGETHKMNAARKRMAMLPAGCEVLSTDSWVPLAYVGNVYILPGIPSLFQRYLNMHGDRFRSGIDISRALIRTESLEGDIAETLSKIQLEYPMLSIGSYVRTKELQPNERPYTIQVSVEGIGSDQVDFAADQLLSALNEAFRHK